jgi:thioredoxin reductase (NADPH)
MEGSNSPLEPNNEVYDVILIGAGPAGSSAAIYTARAGLNTLVIDKGLTAGALGLAAKIANFPGVPDSLSGAELVQRMRSQAQSFGATFLTGKVVGIDLSSSPKMVFVGTDTYLAHTVILATGSMGRTETLSGENSFVGRGVSYCATCDGAFYRNMVVAVVGMNDEALEDASLLTRFAEKVLLFSPVPTLKASPDLLEKVSDHPGIEIHLATSVKEIVGETDVEGIRIKPRGKDEQTIPVDGVFVYLQGNKPITDYLMGQLELSEESCISVDDEMQTSIEGVFAVGDLLCSHIRQAVIAASEGATAAIAVEKLLRGHETAQRDWT